jgi:hypothetical protein
VMLEFVGLDLLSVTPEARGHMNHSVAFIARKAPRKIWVRKSKASTATAANLCVGYAKRYV